MSWKSLVTAGLLCVLASPAFAAPTLTAVPGGTAASNRLDANGNWVWTVQITPDLALMPAGDASGTPVAAELGFSSNTNVIGATRNATNFDTLNPGSVIFSGWQTAGNGLLDANSNNRPTGVQLSAPGVGTNAGASYTANSSVSGTDNQVFAALGSVVFTTAGAKDFMTITTKGPTSTSLTTTITTGGVYGTGSTNGRISQINGGTSGGPYTTGNFDTFNNVFTFTALDGDTNLDGHRNGLDTGPFLAGFAAGTGHWQNGDYTGDGLVNGLDTGHLLAGLAAGPPGSGASLGSSGGVPEPASVALLGLAMLGGLGLIGRKR